MATSDKHLSSSRFGEGPGSKRGVQKHIGDHAARFEYMAKGRRVVEGSIHDRFDAYIGSTDICKGGGSRSRNHAGYGRRQVRDSGCGSATLTTRGVRSSATVHRQQCKDWFAHWTIVRLLDVVVRIAQYLVSWQL